MLLVWIFSVRAPSIVRIFAYTKYLPSIPRMRDRRLNYCQDLLIKGTAALRGAIQNTQRGAMTYQQFTEYDVELKVPEEAVQYLDENVRESMAPLLAWRRRDASALILQ